MVFLNLRRIYKSIYYFKEKNECDFVVREKKKIVTAIQVCHGLNEDNKKREINGLVEALEKFDLEEGLILTYSQEEEFTVANKKIALVPVWKWMLND
jgi:predicted AAA+ superfamily ATPase